MYGLAKVALNAEKAREMASQAGIVPAGNWKWALRNARDGQGDLLQGRELAEAKEKMGKLPNNVRQSFQSLARTSGNKEVGGVATQDQPLREAFKGKVNRNAVVPQSSVGNFEVGDKYSVSNLKRLLNEEGDSFDEAFDGLKTVTHDIHTHPHYPAFKHIDPAQKTESAMKSIEDVREYYTPEQLKTMEKRTLLMARDSQGIGTKGNRLVRPSGEGYLLHEPKAYSKDNIEELMGNEQGDYKDMVLQSLYAPNAKSTVLDPMYGNESVHRVRPDGLRSVYFQNKQATSGVGGLAKLAMDYESLNKEANVKEKLSRKMEDLSYLGSDIKHGVKRKIIDAKYLGSDIKYGAQAKLIDAKYAAQMMRIKAKYLGLNLKRQVEELPRLDHMVIEKLNRKSYELMKDDLTPTQRSELEQLLKDKYGVKAKFKQLPENKAGSFMHYHGLREHIEVQRKQLTQAEPGSTEHQALTENLKRLEGMGEHGSINSSDRTQTLLHEAGHSLDPLVFNHTADKLGKLTSSLKYQGIALASLGGTTARRLEDDEENESNIGRNLALGLGVGGAIGIAAFKPVTTEIKEHNADKFLKKFLKNEVEDPQRRKEIMKGRKYGRATYHTTTLAAVLPPLALGAFGYTLTPKPSVDLED